MTGRLAREGASMMPRNALIATGVAGCVIALAACMVQGKSAANTMETPAPEASTQAPGGPATSTAPAAVVERGRDALRAAGLPADSKLLSSEQTQWSDSSLGCAQPGAMYTQVITSGYVLRFAGADAPHEIHVA